MRAVGFDENGGPEVLRSVAVPAPQAGPGEILVQVAYAGVNYAEVQHRLGDFGPPDLLDIPGMEVSGHVAALGEGVSGFVVGDPVAAYLPDGGGYAEFAVAPAHFVFSLRTPMGEIDLRTAGGAALVLPTAYGILAEAVRLRPGDTVLIHAAAGGVGSVAAQIARALGAGAVYGTVGNDDKAVYAKRFGYDAVFQRDGFPDAVRDTTGGRGVDVVLDPIGGPTRIASLEVLAPFGRIAVYGEAARHPDLNLPVLPLWKHNRALTGYNIGDVSRRAPDLLRAHALAALELVASGAVRIDVTDVLPLAAAAQAHERMQAGRNQGKTLLRT
ncbi:quinone oxidoreductase family protein [Streptosporangium sp. NBC_01756]|uniref:quinone oxidoreductase family protein n=1 Tax=Streptosporangium sp. NBC_01756 TaxID=2975950 RepID=UPI002DDC836D|nr:zinc-binding dehydrogenase [Streptosporangium sp. NBC_01756]WSC89485.1 zinc-binding dehydrogenase [Streptosporangium sp. NBC_01756]